MINPYKTQTERGMFSVATNPQDIYFIIVIIFVLICCGVCCGAVWSVIKLASILWTT